MLLSVWALISDVRDAMEDVSSRLYLLGTSDGNPAKTASELLDMLERDELEDCRNIL